MNYVRYLLFGATLQLSACLGPPPLALVQCVSSDDCKSGETCVSGDCVLLCSLDTDCASGQICTEGKCVAGARCQSAADCTTPGLCQTAQNASCDGGKCSYRTTTCTTPPPPSCTPNDDGYITYESFGTCTASTGECEYTKVTVPCSNCTINCLKACEQLNCDQSTPQCHQNARCNPLPLPACEYSPAPNGSSCNGGAGVCSAGACVECHSAADCDDGNPCTLDTCDGNTCSYQPQNGATCDLPGSPVGTGDGQCVGSSCGGCVTHADCDDFSDCTTDTCDGAGTCVNTPGACTAPNDLCNTAQGTCVECLDHGDCGGGTSICNTTLGKCVECTADADCSGTLLCDTAQGVCVECTTASDCNDGNGCTTDTCNGGVCVNTADACADPTPVCSGSTCVQCTNNTHCSAPTPICDTASNTCVGCVTSAHCDDDNACTTDTCSGGVCSNTAGACGGSTPICSGTACVECISNTDCGGSTPFCVNQKCVACTSSSHCDDGNACTVNQCINNVCNFSTSACTGSKPYCSGGQCVACTTNGHCSAPTPYCNTGTGNCAQCVTSQHCADSTVCTSDVCSGGTCFHLPANEGKSCESPNYTCQSGQCRCFATGTPVRTQSGWRPIEDVQVGERVLSYDEQTGRNAWAEVTEVERKWTTDLAELHLDTGERIVATPNHPFFVEGVGWVPLSELQPGERLATRSDDTRAGAAIHVRRVQRRTGDEGWVYNLVVSPSKTYHVGSASARVHSCDAPLNILERSVKREALTGGENAGEPVLVHRSLKGDFVLVHAPGAGASPITAMPCMRTGTWATRVGVVHDTLVVLDSNQAKLRLFPLAEVRAVHAGTRSCSAEQPLGRELSLPSRELAYEASISEDGRLAISYFGSNRVELFNLAALFDQAAATAPAQELVIPGATGMGLSAVRILGGALFATDVAWQCKTGNSCPELFGDAQLVAVDLTEESGPVVTRTAHRNPLALHVQAGELFVLNGGETNRGFSSIQRVLGRPQLGPELALPQGASPARAHALTGTSFAVLQLSGDHMFIVDAARFELSGIVRFNGEAFVEVPADVTELPARTHADLHDMISVPGSRDHYLLVDSKNEQLIHARLKHTGVGFDILGRTALSAEAEVDSNRSIEASEPRTMPSWGVWLSGR